VDFLFEDRIVLERPGVGDLNRVGDDQEALEALLRSRYPRKSPETIRHWALTLLRFAFTAVPGDLIVHPDTHRKTLSFGRVVGAYFWRPDVDQHCRQVEWRRTDIRREQFSAAAQQAAGGRAAFFAINGEAAEEFETYVANARGRR
jgi:predicted Mrr-cat superfamily restriction endonuclease